jgi:uncharacterized protein YndB with AHSA1/START domain
MDTLSFKSFTRKIYLNASLKSVYNCWASEAGICSWFLRKATFSTADGTIRARQDSIAGGDSYIWRWHNWNGEERGEILEANGKDRISFTFGGSSVVSVDLEEEGTRILLCLTQGNIPEDEESKLYFYVGCNTGWTFWLTNLKAYLEHGILLNETETDLSGDSRASYYFVNI